jgi:hypothetical protein
MILMARDPVKKPGPWAVAHFKSAAPLRLLAAPNLAQVQHLSLDHFAAAHAPVLDNAPVAVLLAVLDSSLRP